MQQSIPVIDDAGNILIGTLLQDVKKVLAKLEKRVTELERQIELHQPISANSEQIKELLEFRRQFEAGPILERLTKLEQNSQSISITAAATQTETCTSTEIDQVASANTAPVSIDDTLSKVLGNLQSYLSFLHVVPAQRRYSRSNSTSMRKRSESKRSRWSGISSGIGMSFEYEDAQSLHELQEEPVTSTLSKKPQEPPAVENIISTEVEPTDSQRMTATAQVGLHQEQAVLWAMEDLLLAMKSLRS